MKADKAMLERYLVGKGGLELLQNYTKLLVPVDESEQSQKILREGSCDCSAELS